MNGDPRSDVRAAAFMKPYGWPGHIVHQILKVSLAFVMAGTFNCTKSVQYLRIGTQTNAHFFKNLVEHQSSSHSLVSSHNNIQSSD